MASLANSTLRASSEPRRERRIPLGRPPTTWTYSRSPTPQVLSLEPGPSLYLYLGRYELEQPEPEPEEEDSWGEAPANQWNDFNV